MMRVCSNLVFELCLPAAFPLLKHLGQFIQPRMVEVKDLILALSAGDDQLPTGTGLIAETHTHMKNKHSHKARLDTRLQEIKRKINRYQFTKGPGCAVSVSTFMVISLFLFY